MGYIEEGHDPALDRPTVEIPKPKIQKHPRTPREKRENALLLAKRRRSERRHQLRVMRRELDHVMQTDPSPEAFRAYKRLTARLAALDTEDAACAAAERELVRQRLLSPPKVRESAFVSPIARMRERRAHHEWVRGWRGRLKALEKHGRL